ncbi:MAG: NAD(P)-dependent alcohol dehydrogenase [Sphingomonas sp.]
MATVTDSYAAPGPGDALGPWPLERRDPGPRDVEIAIDYCGVCHSDIHTVRGEWGAQNWPFVPGHEIVGHVVGVGADVTRHAVGDVVGVGCMVDSCRHCPPCRSGNEQFCDNGFNGTYSGIEKPTGKPTYGGYSAGIVVDEDFVLRIPAGLDPAGAAPLLCAGITTWSPLRHWKVKPGDRIGVVGLGGLGHVAIKLAHAMGAHVVLFTTSPGKAADALRLGADEVVISTDPAAMAAQACSLDFVLDTVSAPHDLDDYLALLRIDGTLALVGMPASPHPPIDPASLILKRRSIAGSITGGLPATQEMLDFCAAHGIAADIEIIAIDRINHAYERLLAADVKYRFVIDMATLTDRRES